jgi:hypothetical protein
MQQQYQEYAPYPAQPQQYFEAAPAPGYGGGGPPAGYQQPAGYLQYAPEPSVQYVQQAPQAGYYVESAPQFQQQYTQGAPQLIQPQQPMHMPQSPPMPMAQSQHYGAAPQPAFQQPLGNGGKGKLIKAGR